MIIYNNDIVEYQGNIINFNHVDPYNPLNLPPYTVRAKLRASVTPTAPSGYTSSVTLVDSINNIWDLCLMSSSWYFDDGFFHLFGDGDIVLEILGANTTGVTNMYKFCYQQELLTSVVPFDISSVTETRRMFANCIRLTSIPAFNPSLSLTNTEQMFNRCRAVESGALALYNAMSALNISSHYATFRDCGSDTITGAAELAQIPSGWK